MLCILSTRYAAEFTTQRRTPCQPSGVEKPSSYYISVCVCVWCATPYWEYLSSNPAVIYWITYQIWANSDTHATIQARWARVAVLEIPLWCFFVQVSADIAFRHERAHTNRHTQVLSSLVGAAAPFWTFFWCLLPNAICCTEVHMHAHTQGLSGEHRRVTFCRIAMATLRKTVLRPHGLWCLSAK